MDSDLSALERRMKEQPDDVNARLRYRLACLRAGRPELAGILPGDKVRVDEVEHPWVRGPWDGLVIRVFEVGDKYVRPLHGARLDYLVQTSPEYVEQGLFITRKDRTILIEPALPE